MRKNGIAAEHLRMGYETLFVNGCFDLHRALGMRQERGSRVFWRYLLDQKAFGNALRYLYRFE